MNYDPDKHQVYEDPNGLKVLARNVEAKMHPDGNFYHIRMDKCTMGLKFQSGSPRKHGVNGHTNESMLAVLIHRTKVLDGEFPSDQNKLAIEHMEKALAAFEARTKERVERGVEGQHAI